MISMRGNEHDQALKAMFSRIARRYILANRWMTWGQDSKWRQRVITLAKIPRQGTLLDLGTGTGDLILQAVQRDASLMAVAADITSEMMQVGRERPSGEQIRWLNTDALDLPFDDETFDAVVSGYLLRNVIDVGKSLGEQYRVLKWGGRMVSLDTTPPPVDFWHLPVHFYLKYLVPFLGRSITGDKNAYTYLSDSTRNFLKAIELRDCLIKAGFKDAGYCNFMGGAMAIHWGMK